MLIVVNILAVFRTTHFQRKLAPAKKIYLYAPTWGDIFETLANTTNTDNVSASRDGCRDHIILLKDTLRQQGSILQQITYPVLRHMKKLEPYERLVCFDIKKESPDLKSILAKFSPEQCLLVLWEPPTLMPFSYDLSYHNFFNKIFTFYDPLVDNKHYLKLYYPHSLTLPKEEHAFKEKKLCALIAGKKQWIAQQPLVDLYQKREELISFFEQHAPQAFDLYGVGWDPVLMVYRGTTPSKKDCLRNYKFCIAYENTGNLIGYITEKIFDSMSAGAVPVYWGAYNITDYIPANCFIDARNFATADDLYNYLNAMQEPEYNKLRTAIDAFLVSVNAQLFSHNHFVQSIVQALAYKL